MCRPDTRAHYKHRYAAHVPALQNPFHERQHKQSTPLLLLVLEFKSS